MKQLGTCLIVFLFAFSLCSCWDYTELNQRHIATGLSIDHGESLPYLMTVELMSFEGGKATDRLICAEGDSLDSCVQGLIRQLGRTPYWNHAKLILLEESLFEKEGVSLLDWFLRAHDFSLGILVAEAQGCAAYEILSCSMGADPNALVINQMLDDQIAFGQIPACPLYHLYNAMMGDGQSVSVPRLTLISQREGISEPDSSGEGSSSGGSSSSGKPDSSDSGSSAQQGDSEQNVIAYSGALTIEGGKRSVQP